MWLEDAELSPQEADWLIERIATQVVKRGMAVPATLLLELHAPIHMLGSSAVAVLMPVLGPLFGPEQVNRYRLFLEKRENVERLVDRIQQLEHDPPAAGDEPAEHQPHPNATT